MTTRDWIDLGVFAAVVGAFVVGVWITAPGRRPVDRRRRGGPFYE